MREGVSGPLALMIVALVVFVIGIVIVAVVFMRRVRRAGDPGRKDTRATSHFGAWKRLVVHDKAEHPFDRSRRLADYDDPYDAETGVFGDGYNYDDYEDTNDDAEAGRRGRSVRRKPTQIMDFSQLDSADVPPQSASRRASASLFAGSNSNPAFTSPARGAPAAGAAGPQGVYAPRAFSPATRRSSQASARRPSLSGLPQPGTPVSQSQSGIPMIAPGSAGASMAAFQNAIRQASRQGSARGLQRGSLVRSPSATVNVINDTTLGYAASPQLAFSQLPPPGSAGRRMSTSAAARAQLTSAGRSVGDLPGYRAPPPMSPSAGASGYKARSMPQVANMNDEELINFAMGEAGESPGGSSSGSGGAQADMEMVRLQHHHQHHHRGGAPGTVVRSKHEDDGVVAEHAVSLEALDMLREAETLLPGASPETNRRR
jgi:hypothetical protein